MSDNCCNLQMSVDEAPRLAMQISGANYYGPYQLPTMSATVKGGAKLGSGLEIDSDTLSIDLTDEATGESVTAADASYLAALTVNGKAVQDGTPTPSAPVPVEVVQSINLANTSNVFMGYVANNQVYADSSNYVVVIPCKPNTAYTLAMTIPNQYSRYSLGVTDVYPAANVAVSNFIPHKLAGGTTGVGQRYTDTITTGANAKYIVAWCGNTSSNYPNGIDFQVEEGSTAAPYIPYGSIGLKVGSTITPIDLQGNVLASLPDGTKDVLTVDSVGHVVLEKRIGVHVFDGIGETWTLSGNQKRVSTTELCNEIKKPNADTELVYTLCSSFVAKPATQTWGGIVGVSVDVPGSVGFANGSTMATDTWEAWLSSNNVTLYYPLATPQTIDLGYIDIPEIPDGAEISITAQVTPTITASWWARGAAAIAEAFKSLRDGLLARIEAIETAIADL